MKQFFPRHTTHLIASAEQLLKKVLQAPPIAKINPLAVPTATEKNCGSKCCSLQPLHGWARRVVRNKNLAYMKVAFREIFFCFEMSVEHARILLTKSVFLFGYWNEIKLRELPDLNFAYTTLLNLLGNNCNCNRSKQIRPPQSISKVQATLNSYFLLCIYSPCHMTNCSPSVWNKNPAIH